MKPNQLVPLKSTDTHHIHHSPFLLITLQRVHVTSFVIMQSSLSSSRGGKAILLCKWLKFPTRAAIGRVLINVLMMSDGGRYWGHRTWYTDANDQLNARSVPHKVWESQPWPLVIRLDEAVMRKDLRGWFKWKKMYFFLHFNNHFLQVCLPVEVIMVEILQSAVP